MGSWREGVKETSRLIESKKSRRSTMEGKGGELFNGIYPVTELLSWLMRIHSSVGIDAFLTHSEERCVVSVFWCCIFFCWIRLQRRSLEPTSIFRVINRRPPLKVSSKFH